MIALLKNYCLLFVLLPFTLSGQSHFDLRLDTLTLPGLPGAAFFAVAEHTGKWLLIGGRRDGMHHKFGSFGTNLANQHIWVADPGTGQTWQRALAELPDTLQEQLRSTNMEFLQEGQTLLFAGGYGRSEVAQNHITYPYLTLVNVPGLIDAVVNGGALLPHFQQLRDTFFAVAGGQLQQLADTFYLVGGHRFDGVYSANSANPTQFYTDAIRKFTLATGNGSVQVTAKNTVKDELNLHRRDYNLAPQIFRDGEVGLAAFSGVFQPGLSLSPFLNLVEIRPSGHAPVNGFSQFLANYHCARVPLFAQSANEMHTLFFGGISQYWLNGNDSMIRDNRLPFVKTVSRVSRLADGRYEEVPFKAELPRYTGAGAEFILASGVPTLHHGIVDFDALPEGEQLLGYIVGGIVTPDSQRNPFVANTPGLTSASDQLIRVFIAKNTTGVSPGKPLDGRYNLGLTVAPNPARDRWQLQLNLPRSGRLRGTLQDGQGKIVAQTDWGQQAAGTLQLRLDAANLPAGAYWLTANLDGVFVETKAVTKL